MSKQPYEKIIAKCWADSAFKQQLLAHPAATLKSEGLELPEGLKVNVVENTAEQFTFVIPAQTAELTDDMLEGVAGGYPGGARRDRYTAQEELYAPIMRAPMATV